MVVIHKQIKRRLTTELHLISVQLPRVMQILISDCLAATILAPVAIHIRGVRFIDNNQEITLNVINLVLIKCSQKTVKTNEESQV